MKLNAIKMKLFVRIHKKMKSSKYPNCNLVFFNTKRHLQFSLGFLQVQRKMKEIQTG